MRSSRTRSCAGSRRPPTDAWRRRPGAWGRQARGPRGSDHGTCCAGACIDAPAQCLLAGRVGACRTHGAAARSHGTPAGRPIGIKRRVSRRGRPSRRADRAACRARALPCLQSGGRVTVVRVERGGGAGRGSVLADQLFAEGARRPPCRHRAWCLPTQGTWRRFGAAARQACALPHVRVGLLYGGRASRARRGGVRARRIARTHGPLGGRCVGLARLLRFPPPG